MPPDLTAAREVARRQCTDTCTITFDASGVDDDVLNPDTLELSKPGGDDTTVYSGACLIGQSQAAEAEVGDGYVAATRRIVRLPFDAPLPSVGSILTVTASADADLVGTRHRVVSAEPRSVYVFRTLTVERSTPVVAA